MDAMDGFRFCFICKRDGTTVMRDALGQFDSIVMPDKLGEVLAKMLAEQHRLRIAKDNQFATLHALIQVAQETDLDKDVLIACINNSGVMK